MLLVYSLLKPDKNGLPVQGYSMEIDPGKPLRGTRYPVNPDRMLKGGAAGIRLQGLDNKLLLEMTMRQGGRSPFALFLGRDAARMMENLCKTGRAYAWCQENRPLQLGQPLAGELGWSADDVNTFGTVLLPQGALLLPARPLWYLIPETAVCGPVTLPVPDDVAWAWATAAPRPHAHAMEAFASLTARYPEAPLPPPPSLQHEIRLDAPFLARLSLKPAPPKTSAAWLADPEFVYGGKALPADQKGSEVRFLEGSTLVEVPRDLRREQRLMEALTACGLVESFPEGGWDLFQEKSLQYALPAWKAFDEWVAEGLPALRKAGWEVDFAEGAAPVTPTDEDWYTDLSDGKRGWMSFEQGVMLAGKRINLLPILHEFLQQRDGEPLDVIREWLRTHDLTRVVEGRVLIIPGQRFLRMVDQLYELFGKGALDTQKRLRFNPWRATELALQGFLAWEPPAALQQAVATLRGTLDIPPLAAPDGFLGELRAYQQQGLGWLQFLHDTQMGGILADDMGLGKTVQVIALLQHRRLARPEAPPALIICPTSVLPNWRLELERFAPTLSVLSMVGSDRAAQTESLDQVDVILTTYPLIWRDEALYRQGKFSTLILDEAQALKNPKSRAHQSVAALDAACRIALTGTPCENHLGDLWAIFNIVMPGFLSDEKSFRNGIRIPIERDNCPVIRQALRERIRPLLLRRQKDLVAKELPPKTEIIVTVPMSETQIDLYQTVRAAMSEKIQAEMERKGLQRSHITVLDAMLKLRQICCDPRLREGSEATEADSAKLEHLTQMVQELIEEGRRILLFSQFTSMLDLMHPVWKRLKIPFVEIRGDTRDRETPVRRFQAGEVPLFLISLRAGGSGLNLTEADTVIHYDPWWNPAVEAQATDRAHRIGQQKPVFVYKLICQGSIEQTILEMQAEKKDLAGLLEGSGDRALQLSESEIQRLMSPLL